MEELIYQTSLTSSGPGNDYPQLRQCTSLKRREIEGAISTIIDGNMETLGELCNWAEAIIHTQQERPSCSSWRLRCLV